MPDELNPYEALERVKKFPRRVRDNLMRLEVWCEWNKCTPIRVFELREGLLVQCRSDADISDMQEQFPHLDRWSRRKAFFIEEWLSLGSGDEHLQVVCRCLQTKPRLVSVGKLHSEVPENGTRRIRLPAVAADIG